MKTHVQTVRKIFHVLLDQIVGHGVAQDPGFREINFRQRGFRGFMITGWDQGKKAKDDE
jgi:hypothetical protein